MWKEIVSIPDNDYHEMSLYRKGLYLSSHALIDFIKSPALFRGKENGVIPLADSDAFVTGRAAHCLILEGRSAFDSRYITGGPINPKTEKPYGTATAKYQDWKAEQTKEVLSAKDVILYELLAASTMQHAEIAHVLNAEGAIDEATCRTTYCGMLCQIRIDWLTSTHIVDLKTCRDLDRFEYDFRDYRYANQLSFYQKVFESGNCERLPVLVIAAEKQSPYRAALYEIDQALLNKAQRENEDAIHKLRNCRASLDWPTGFEGIRKIA